MRFLNRQNAKKVWEKAKDIGIIITLISGVILAIIGGEHLTKYFIRERSTYDDSMIFVAETADGTAFFIEPHTIHKNGNGCVSATILIQWKYETALYHQKMAELLERGIQATRGWGIERDLEIDFEKEWYRFVERRIVDHKGRALVTYCTPDAYWMKIRDHSPLFRNVLNEIRQLQPERG